MKTQEITIQDKRMAHHMGHPHMIPSLTSSIFFGETNEWVLDLGPYATRADIELMRSWKMRDPHWWRKNMKAWSESIRFVDGWVRVGERFLLRESLGENTFTYIEAVRRIEGFAPISKYIDCFRLMPSGNLLDGTIKKWYIQGDAIRELGRLIGARNLDYWSSTPCSGHDELAWSVNFHLGYAANHRKTTKCSMGYII